MSTFDDSKPFGTVRGLPGVVYDQGGHLFNARKEPVDERGNPVKSGKPADAPKAETAPVETVTAPDAAQPAKAPAKKRSPRRKKAPAVPEGVRPLREQVKDEA